MRLRRLHLLLGLLGVAVCAIPFHAKLQRTTLSAIQILKGRKTVAERVAEFGTAVHSRLEPSFRKAGVGYPPKSMVLLGLKEERVLEVWANDGTGSLRHLKTYPILAASGTLGPKLAEGDQQVPEGIYTIESLNPNSLFHLALRVGYPNGFDREKAGLDGRESLGSDIMIHGKAASVGCLAMGDQAIEELFMLVAKTGIGKVKVVLSPVDFRSRELPTGLPNLPSWTPELYTRIRNEMRELRTHDGPERK